MVLCKSCASEQVVKNGLVREKPRFKCKARWLNFVEGDKRVKEEVTVKKALAEQGKPSAPKHETLDHEEQDYPLAATGQIVQHALVAAVNARRIGVTERAGTP